MIHGKFFAGLPPRMMDRTNGPNRQQSNLFWPDESDVKSASENKSKRRHKIAQQTSVESNSSYNNDIEPKELVKKQLTSKIEFYDMMDDVNVKSSTPKNHEPNGRQKKLDPFSSKIEFYDYADDVNIHVPKTDKNSKKDVERNSKNSPKTIDKRIKFVEETVDVNEIPPPKGILKNNETNPKDKSVQEQSRKKLIKKRNLSKSVENLSTRSRDFNDDEDDCINVIENDVKNIMINGRKEMETKDTTQSSWSQQSRKNEITDNCGNRSNIKVDRRHFEDGWDSPEQIDENVYRKSGINQPHVVYHEIHQESRDSCLDSQSSRQNNIARSPKMTQRTEEYEDRDFFSASRPPTRDNVNLNNDNWSRTEKSVNSQNFLPQHQKVTQPPSDQQPVNNRAHRHLVSNIRFGNDIEATTDRPPKSVRNSAFTRVSVGLPD